MTVSSAVPGSTTRQVQLHLGLLATAGSGSSSSIAGICSTGNGSGYSNGRSGGPAGEVAPPPAAARKLQDAGAEQQYVQYVVSSQPSRHLVVLGVKDKSEAAVVCQLARTHGRLQAFLLHRPQSSLTLHFDEQAAAEATAAEVAGKILPGMSCECCAGSPARQAVESCRLQAGPVAAGCWMLVAAAAVAVPLHFSCWCFCWCC